MRVSLSASLQDVAAGVVRIELRGEHVPSGVQLIPPPLNGLKPIPSVLVLLRAECLDGKLPTIAVNSAVAALGEDADRNTRLAPPARVLAGCKKSSKRAERGSSMDDATRIDVLVRQHLIQRGMVLLYLPGPWGAARAHNPVGA